MGLNVQNSFRRRNKKQLPVDISPVAEVQDYNFFSFQIKNNSMIASPESILTNLGVNEFRGIYEWIRSQLFQSLFQAFFCNRVESLDILNGPLGVD